MEHGLEIHGKLNYTPWTKLSSNIMGPYQYVPGLPCRHSIFSLAHDVSGTITLNGEEYTFYRDIGYVEGDRGNSFPEHYIWTQCSRQGHVPCSIMAAVADVPIGARTILGCIAVIYYKKETLRLSSYLGAHVVYRTPEELLIRQGKYRLHVQLIRTRGHVQRELWAPDQGNMSRSIYESAACNIRYRLLIDDRTVLDFVSEQASYEVN